MKAVIIICSLLAVLFVSCDGMNDNIKEYLDRGEIAYIGKADSVTTAGGINRIKLLWKINSDPRITSCKILWNDKQDSVSFPIDRGEVDKNGYLSYILEDMPEGTFIFNLYHVGVDNSLSMGSEIEGTVYGDIYKSNLNPRKIRLVETLADKVNLYWEEGGNSSNVLFTYINRTGEKKDNQYSCVGNCYCDR